jgi:uncharacterized protein (UPF0264 family)
MSDSGPRTRLLVSVRCAAEAAAALAGGADLIDVKEPAHGPLGRAEDGRIAAVLRQVAGRRPVSAALGELADGLPVPACRGLTFVKWGLAGWPRGWDWRQILAARMAEVPHGPQVVVVAYADWEKAGAPPVEEVVQFTTRRGGTLLLDTYEKGRSLTLFDWLAADDLIGLCAACRAAGVRVAVAGSLGPGQIAAALAARPDWIAVRGAACVGGRGGAVEAGRVRALADLIATSPTSFSDASQKRATPNASAKRR